MKQVMRDIFLIPLIVGLVLIIQGSGVSQAQDAGDLEGFRTKLLSILNAYQEVANTLQSSEAQSRVAEAQRKVEALTVKDLAGFGQKPPELTAWGDAVETLRARVKQAVSSAKLSRQSVQAASSAPHPELPAAPYSSRCGSQRQDTEVVFASETALFVAETVKEEASRPLCQYG